MGCGFPLLITYSLAFWSVYLAGGRGKLAVMLILLITLLPCLILAIRHRQQCLARPAEGGDIAGRKARLVAKILAVTVIIVVMLLYAAAMARLGVHPFSVFLSDLYLFFPAVMALLVWHVVWVDRRQEAPEDDYYWLGMLLRGRSTRLPTRQFMLSLSLKIFFIPTMYGFLVVSLTVLLDQGLPGSFSHFIRWLFLFGVSYDLTVATAGYVFCSRLFGNDIRGIDQTWGGWAACLVCYPPFLYLIHQMRDGADFIVWTDWLSPDSALYWIWGGMICLTWFVYWISTAHFGLRFANLSWRGLVDVGLYRYVKHPAYLSKNLYWWLHAVPFAGYLSGMDLFLHLLVMSTISLVYFIRAKTEERHLVQYPEYRAYLSRMNNAGLLHALGRLSARLFERKPA